MLHNDPVCPPFSAVQHTVAVLLSDSAVLALSAAVAPSTVAVPTATLSSTVGWYVAARACRPLRSLSSHASNHGSAATRAARGRHTAPHGADELGHLAELLGYVRLLEARFLEDLDEGACRSG